VSGLIFYPQEGNNRQVGFGVPIPNTDELVAFGQHAIGVLAPARSEVNIFGIIAEFLQGIPRLPFSSLEKWEGVARNGADEFLNYVFGIQPTVGDISRLIKVLTNVSTRLDQLQRDAGASVRREWTLPVSQKSQEFSGDQINSAGTIRYRPDWQDTTDSRDFQYQGPILKSDQYQEELQTSLILGETISYRFDGSFTYYLPTSKGWWDDWKKESVRFNRVLSFLPDTEVLWNLIPYSWLVDWMVNISDVLRTMEVASDDSLVVNWAYASRLLQRQVIQVSKHVSTSSAGKPDLRNVSTIYRVTEKRRLRGNPYGFSTQTSADWTPLRFAILGALGISRAPRYH
jgi:hypothetical protein